jgi:hypothetical protein
MKKHPRFQTRLLRPAVISLALCLPLLCRADTVVAPGQLATTDSIFGAGPLGAPNYRSQRMFGPSHFPQGIALVITELRFRPDRFYGFAFTSTVPNIQFNLSTSTRDPNALVDATYANNVGDDDTVVFSGAITLSSRFTGPANGPKDFDIVIPLTTPFIYNPEAGSLLVDIRNFSGGVSVSPLSGTGVSTDSATRVGGSLAGASGSPDHGAEAMQFVYTPTNAPPVPPSPVWVKRGPYLQLVTTTNIIVRWRTNRATNSVVTFGASSLSHPWAITNATWTNEHVVTLTNLSPDTKYYYAVAASDTNLSGGPDHFFTTAPARPRPTRIWAIGDSGCADQPRYYTLQDPFAVRNAYTNYTGTRPTDVWLMLGDNGYMTGTDESYQTNVFGTYPSLLRQTALWSTIGNHEVYGPGPDAPAYLNLFSFPENGQAGGAPSGTERYYSFNYGNIHFVCIDSEVSSRALGDPMLTWLEQDLAANTNDWLIAFWHSPPYTHGSHYSDSASDSGGKLIEMRERVVPILEDYGVDLVLCGHSHNYERTMLIDGHYGLGATFTASMAKDSGSGRIGESGPYLKTGTGPTPHEGAVYIVCGSSGWVTPGHSQIPAGQYLKHPASFTGLAQLGSMVIDVDGRRLDARFLRETGAIDDSFTMIKGRAPEPLRLATFRSQGGTITAQLKTRAGYTYRIERAASLSTPDWQPISGNITATGSTTKWTGAAAGGPENYYRAVLVSTP